ncbi:MAG: DUF4238 domain-containing protein [Proteobacteria bacterium]|uniref:DUF4238 domain-containing protein n=1 Tax=Aquabacterium sp. TaxID=1872578 RepID=UPI0035C6DAE1|nr:DUF4238 domain-containing protein [Pseudomonadota bacterium]
MSHTRHHYVPVFLLEKWGSPKNPGTRFCWRNGRLLEEPKGPRQVCFEEHLYSFDAGNDVLDVAVERDFWGPQVDDPAARVLSKMVTRGAASLTEGDRLIWSRFLVGQLLRVPHVVRHMRKRGEQIWARVHSTDVDATEQTSEGVEDNEELEQRYLAWACRLNPETPGDLGVLTMPALVESSVLNPPCLAANWVVRSVVKSPVRLLIGDAPLIYLGRLDRDFLLLLPIGPAHLFCAYTSPVARDCLSRISDLGLVRLVNRETCERAVQWVYGSDPSLRALVSRRLRMSPSHGC